MMNIETLRLRIADLISGNVELETIKYTDDIGVRADSVDVTAAKIVDMLIKDGVLLIPTTEKSFNLTEGKTKGNIKLRCNIDKSKILPPPAPKPLNIRKLN